MEPTNKTSEKGDSLCILWHCLLVVGLFFQLCDHLMSLQQFDNISQVKHNDVMKAGSRVYLPVAESRISKRFVTIPSGTLYPNADEIQYLQRLVMYKDSAVIIFNKPPKLPVKGNLLVHNSMDALAAAALSYDNDEGLKLRIPPLFKKHLLKDLPRSSKGLLKGPSGRIWYVKVVKTENDIFLKGGWQKFVRQNSLGNNEFLLFTYDGNLCFNVQIFDVFGTERVSMSADPREDPDPSASENDRAEPSHIRQPFEEKGKKKVTDTKSRRERNMEHTPETSSLAHNISSKKKTNRNRRLVKSFTSKLPYFEVRLKSYNVGKACSMHIPNAFSHEYLPGEKTMVVLRNHKEETWKVNSIPYGHNGQNYGFYGGWGAFLRDNNLKESDVCIFELVDVAPLVMKVHVFQSGSNT